MPPARSGRPRGGPSPAAWRRGLGLGGLGLALALLARCATNPVTGQSELMLVSEADELALGQAAYPALRWQDGGPLRVDPATQGYLDGIVERLHAVSHRPTLPVDFTLHSASAPNAWAIPGHTAMNRGLLQALENEAQFAFVMGHELGHVAARHSARRQTYGIVGDVLLGAGAVALGSQGVDGPLAQLALGGAALGTQLVLLRYDRQQELQADELGVRYMARAGYDPREAVRAHEVLERAVDGYLANLGQSRAAPGPITEFLSTHPRHEVRVAELARLVEGLPPAAARPDGDGRFAARWAAATAGVRALAPAYVRYDRARLALSRQDGAAAEAELGAARAVADQAQFATLEGGLLRARGRAAEAEAAYRRARALFPGYQPALHGLGALAYGEGQPARAVAPLEDSLRLRPGYAPSEQLLGLALARLGRASDAVPHLRAAAAAAPRDPELHGILAQQYEQLGDSRAALAAWRAQLSAAPDSPLGRQARQRVAALGGAVTTSYASAPARVRVEHPESWEVTRDHAIPRGGELELRRQAPEVRVRVTSTDYGEPRDVQAALEAWIKDRLPGSRVLREARIRLGPHPALARYVEARGVETLVAATARGTRLYWVQVTAERSAWRDAAIRAEIDRLLAALAF